MLFPDVYAALRAHKLLLILGTLACVVATFVVTNAQEKYYEAAAVVRIEPTSESSPNDRYEASQRLARTYAEVYERGAVNARMRNLLGTRVPIGEDELVAQQVKDLDLLSVGALTTDPRRSANLANAGWRALEDLSRRDTLILVTPAVIPDTPASPNLKLNLLLALFAGLILSTGVALILHAVRQPIPDAEGVERDFGLPVLATIPHLEGRYRPARGHAAPLAAQAEAAPPSAPDGDPAPLSPAGSRQTSTSRRA